MTNLAGEVAGIFVSNARGLPGLSGRVIRMHSSGLTKHYRIFGTQELGWPYSSQGLSGYSELTEEALQEAS